MMNSDFYLLITMKDMIDPTCVAKVTSQGIVQRVRAFPNRDFTVKKNITKKLLSQLSHIFDVYHKIHICGDILPITIAELQQVWPKFAIIMVISKIEANSICKDWWNSHDEVPV